MKRIWFPLLFVCLTGCATLDEPRLILASATVIPDGASFAIEAEGRFLSGNPGLNRPPRLMDFWTFEGREAPWIPAYARVSRVGSELRIELVTSEGRVIAKKVVSVAEIKTPDGLLLRHSERASDGDEWGSIYSVDREDFFTTADGEFVIHCSSKGVGRTFLVVPYPHNSGFVVSFPRRRSSL